MRPLPRALSPAVLLVSLGVLLTVAAALGAARVAGPVLLGTSGLALVVAGLLSGRRRRAAVAVVHQDEEQDEGPDDVRVLRAQVRVLEETVARLAETETAIEVTVDADPPRAALDAADEVLRRVRSTIQGLAGLLDPDADAVLDRIDAALQRLDGPADFVRPVLTDGALQVEAAHSAPAPVLRSAPAHPAALPEVDTDTDTGAEPEIQPEVVLPVPPSAPPSEDVTRKRGWLRHGAA